MKKILASIIALALIGTASAYAQEEGQQQEKQRPTPEEMAERQASKMASELLLSDAEAAKFTPVFKAYKLEIRAVNDQYRPAKRDENMKGTPLSDDEVKARIEANFEKSQKILDIRKAYFQKFQKVLTIKQIKKLYDSEKTQGDRAAMNRFQKKHGGPQGAPQK